MEQMFYQCLLDMIVTLNLHVQRLWVIFIQVLLRVAWLKLRNLHYMSMSCNVSTLNRPSTEYPSVQPLFQMLTATWMLFQCLVNSILCSPTPFSKQYLNTEASILITAFMAVRIGSWLLLSQAIGPSSSVVLSTLTGCGSLGVQPGVSPSPT